jgi:hypothetical protein
MGAEELVMEFPIQSPFLKVNFVRGATIRRVAP